MVQKRAASGDIIFDLLSAQVRFTVGSLYLNFASDIGTYFVELLCTGPSFDSVLSSDCYEI